MTFWIRHIFLLLLCVVVPLGAALYSDTESEIARAKRAGATAARLAGESLHQGLELKAHGLVSSVAIVSRKVGEDELLRSFSSSTRRRKRAVEQAAEILGPVTPMGGFVWLVDAEGNIVWKNGQTEPAESPRSIAGHPAFIKSQLGYAFDAYWQEDGITMLAVAPVAEEGVASGAIFLGKPVGTEFLNSLAANLDAQLTLVAREELVASTLDPSIAGNVVEQTKSPMDPVHSGRLEEPLRHEMLPFLPVLVDKHAEGVAFTSAAHTAPASDVRWVVSVPSAEPLQDLAQRQEILFGVLIASLLLALLVGLVNHRTFVSPIGKIAEHLSDVQMGKGEVELPEGKVSRPFRRLVRLINMTVQKLPPRTFGGSASLSDSSPISELPHAPPSTGDLVGSTGPIGSTPLDAGSLAGPRTNASSGTSSADLSGFPAAPPPSARPPSPPPPQDAAGSGEVLDAISSMGPPPGAVDAASDLKQDGDDDSAEAIAEAIASLEAQQQAGVDAGLSAPSGPRSAAEIRGGTPQVDSPVDTAEAPAEAVGADPFTTPPEETPAGAVRGGGSFSLDAPAGLGSASPTEAASQEGFAPEATVVAPVQEDLLAKSARDEFTGEHEAMESAKPDATVVASVPADLLAQTADDEQPKGPATQDPHGLDAADHAHFKQVYERFIDMRRRCGEATADLAFDRFLSKLTKNRENLIKKYKCRTVRFQVYEKDGKAALKATPVRAR